MKLLSITVLLLGLFIHTSISGSEQTWNASHLIETEHLSLIEHLHQDQLHASTQKFIQSFLHKYPESSQKGWVEFVYAQSLLASGGDPEQTRSLYYQLRQNYPDAPWINEVLFHGGKLSIEQAAYEEGRWLLRQWNASEQPALLLAEVLSLRAKSWFALVPALKQQNSPNIPSYYRQTLELLSQIPPSSLESSPLKEEVLYMRGASHFFLASQNTEHHIQAISAWQELLKKFPQSAFKGESLFFTAESYFALYQLPNELSLHLKAPPQTIKQHYQNYLDTKDTEYRPIALFRMATLQQNSGAPQQAISLYEAYLKTQDTAFKSESLIALSKLYEEQHDTKKTIQHLKKALSIETNKTNPKLWEKLALAYRENRKFKEQIQTLKQAASQTGFEKEVQYAFEVKLAFAYFEQEQCRSLIEHLKKLPSQSNYQQELSYMRGYCFIKTKNYSDAIKDLEPLINLASFTKKVTPLLKVAYHKSESWQQLSELLQQNYEASKSSFPLLDFELWIYANQKLKRSKPMIKIYQAWKKRLGKAPLTTEHYIHWAKLEEEQQNYRKAKYFYEQALVYSKASETSLKKTLVSKLGKLYGQSKDYRSLTRIYAKVLEPLLEKGSKKYQETTLYIASIYQDKLQDWKFATKWLKKTNFGTYNPIDLESILRLSQVYGAQKQYKAGIQLLEATLTRDLSKSSWLLPIQHQLAILYDKNRQWNHAIGFYQLVASASSTQHQSLIDEAKKRTRELQALQSNSTLKQLMAKEEWKQATEWIQTELKRQVLDSEYLFENWVWIALKQKNWEGVLEAYHQFAQTNSSKAKNIEAYRNQAYALQQLSKHKKSIEFYKKAYQQVKWDKALKTELSYIIASTYLQHLQDLQEAKKWFENVDQGGTSEKEWKSLLWLANQYESEKQAQQSIKTLERLVSRKLSSKSEVYIEAHYRLARLYQKQEQWKRSLKAYNNVAKSPKNPKFEAYQKQAAEQSQAISRYIAQ